MSRTPEPGERVEVTFTDGATGELPPWPTDAGLAAREAFIADMLTRFPVDLPAEEETP
jgi:hypothetical protein